MSLWTLKWNWLLQNWLDLWLRKAKSYWWYDFSNEFLQGFGNGCYFRAIECSNYFDDFDEIRLAVVSPLLFHIFLQTVWYYLEILQLFLYFLAEVNRLLSLGYSGASLRFRVFQVFAKVDDTYSLLPFFALLLLSYFLAGLVRLGCRIGSMYKWYWCCIRVELLIPVDSWWLSFVSFDPMIVRCSGRFLINGGFFLVSGLEVGVDGLLVGKGLVIGLHIVEPNTMHGHYEGIYY